MNSNKIPVIAIFDIGKTNKKVFLFDQDYQIVFEQSATFQELLDEDGDSCEDLTALTGFVLRTIQKISDIEEYELKAVNFSAYGASFVYLDEQHTPLTVLYNYLKEYPKHIAQQLYAQYGGEGSFALETASPPLGSLNSGLQVLRLKKESPELFEHVVYALHLPQYLSCLLTGVPSTDITSIGCHTALWNYDTHQYHQWVFDEGLDKLFPTQYSFDTVFDSTLSSSSYLVGTGLHDSSAAVIPYLLKFKEPFILISTGTWCISLNPFNNTPLTAEELGQDCLFYLSYVGIPVKASRLFGGYIHEQQAKRIADFFGVSVSELFMVKKNEHLLESVRNRPVSSDLDAFSKVNLEEFESAEQAYHSLVYHLVKSQARSTRLIIGSERVSHLCVDGGFSDNDIYMQLLAQEFPTMKVYAASMPQASAIGAAMALHTRWNNKKLPHNLIHLRHIIDV